MDVLQAIRHRREITKFTAEPIQDQDLEKLTQSLTLAPSGNNLPSREFILITNKEMLTELTEATPFMPWLKDAAAAYVIIANPQESKYWLQDASIASGYVWLAATSIGLGAAFGAIYHAEDAEESERRESYVRKRLNIPEHYRVVAIIGIGHPSEQPPAKEMIPLKRVFHEGSFHSHS